MKKKGLTIIDCVEQIQDKHIQQQVREILVSQYKSPDAPCRSVADLISNKFTWGYTPERGQYWEEIYNRVVIGEKI